MVNEIYTIGTKTIMLQTFLIGKHDTATWIHLDTAEVTQPVTEVGHLEATLRNSPGQLGCLVQVNSQ